MQHPYRYSGGLKLSLLTWIRRAVIFPSVSTWVGKTGEAKAGAQHHHTKGESMTADRYEWFVKICFVLTTNHCFFI